MAILIYKNNFKFNKMRYNRQSRRNISRDYFHRQRQRQRQRRQQQHQPQLQPQSQVPTPSPPSLSSIISISSASSTSFHNPSLLPSYRARDFSYLRENQDLQNQVEDLQQQLDDVQANRNF